MSQNVYMVVKLTKQNVYFGHCILHHTPWPAPSSTVYAKYILSTYKYMSLFLLYFLSGAFFFFYLFEQVHICTALLMFLYILKWPSLHFIQYSAYIHWVYCILSPEYSQTTNQMNKQTDQHKNK